jgi:hypothetical protein
MNQLINRRMKNLKALFLCLLLLGTGSNLLAQQNVTLYNMRSLPQRIYANPALRPDAKIFVSIPFLSSHHLNIGNTALNFSKLTDALEADGDSNILNINKLADIFNDRNLMSFSYDVDIVHAGFKLGKNYFSVNATLKSGFKFDYPGDIFDLLFQGNGGANLYKDFDLGFGMEMNQHLELGVAASRDFLDKKLRLGARLKLLNGLNNFNTHKSQMIFNTAEDDFTLSLIPDIELRMSSSVIPITNEGFLGENVGDPTFQSSSLLGFSNMGMGLDLGATYDLSDRIHLSAALNNLGAIKWNTNTFILRSSNPNKPIQFRGVDLSSLLDSAEGGMEDIISQLADSFGEQFQFDTLHQSYTTALNPEFYLGANYNLTKNHNAAILFYGSFFNKKFYPAATVSWNSRITRILSVSVTYSYLNKSFTNAGAGISLSLGPTQWYFVSDNIFGAIRPSSQKGMNLRFGMNFTLGRKVKEGDA